MNITSAPYCQHCRFYHGANRVVCGLHPYGPEGETCSDYVSKARGLNRYRTRGDSWSSRQLHNWKGWQKLLMLGLLVATFGNCCLLGWIATLPTASTSKTTNNSGWVSR